MASKTSRMYRSNLISLLAVLAAVSRGALAAPAAEPEATLILRDDELDRRTVHIESSATGFKRSKATLKQSK